MARSISPQNLYEKLKNRQDLILLDIRNSDQFKKWHIYQSINIPLNKLAKKHKSLSQNKEIIIISEKGKEARTATAILKNCGFCASTLIGGLKGWNGVYDIVEVQPSKSSKLTIFQTKRLGKGCLSYIVILPNQKSAIIIDPTYHIHIYINFLKKQKLKAVAAFDSHIHDDHVSGGRALSKKLSIPYLLSQKSEVAFSFSPLETALPKLFKDIAITILDTPGHTKESVSIALGKSFVFTGDTLLLDMISTSDVDGDAKQSAKLLYQSITKKLFSLDDDIFVLAAHTTATMVPGPVGAATMRYVKRFNAIKKKGTIEEFARLQCKHTSFKPPNYKRIKEINRSGKIRSKEDVDELELGGNFCPTCTYQYFQ